ncbi:hypothetical protein GM418_19325 [Maribellus comscasis]|uniref:DoxX family membrane protein n=1 Tax=Maribellus comscasis TaxID=2681766 RepID=A0A6I6K2J1_9BACT|nr:hypothetical protein GM418_19325 [Maribellus comscasis]
MSVKIARGNYNVALAGRIAMSVMLVFTAMAHFKFTQGMTMMLPEFIPHREIIVWLTGVIEIAAAVGLLIPSLRFVTAWLLIVFFTLILPANVYASFHNVNYQEATFTGNGVNYLWFRIPLQILFILWVYFSSIKFG